MSDRSSSREYTELTMLLDLVRKNSEIRCIRNYKWPDYYQIGINLASIGWIGIMSSGSTV